MHVDGPCAEVDNVVLVQAGNNLPKAGDLGKVWYLSRQLSIQANCIFQHEVFVDRLFAWYLWCVQSACVVNTS